MDTTKQQGLVARHEHVDARVWNQFYGGWFPLAPWSGLDVSYRAELGVSQGKATVPLSHPCANIFRQMRDGVPAPLSIEVNGVFISGQITYAQAESDGEKQVWDLTIELDQKHAHSMLVRAPIQSAADSSDTRISGFLGPVARQLIAGASSRTGLPTYVLVDGEGDPVDVSARNDDTVAGVLEPALSGSNLFVDVRMLLPGQKIPGVGPVERFAGNLERQWENAALDAGLWPHAETNPRITDMVAGPDGVIPPFSWHGEASVDHLGNVLPEPVEGYVWVPFATQAPEIGSSYYTPDRPILDGTRVVTPAELEAHADDFPGWSSFVTVWEPGAVFSELRENEALHEAAKVGLLALPDGTKLPADWGELGPLLDAYVGLDRSGITTPGVYAWRDGPTWIIANAADMQAEKDKRAANLAQKQTPGVLFHFYGERDRREIVFSSVPGGGLKSWSIGYAAPSAAMLIAGAQLDEWTMQQMGMGALPEQAITGEQSSVPADASAMKNIPPVVDQIDVDVQPQARLEGSDVAYHAAGGRVDLSKAGPFFYREKYLNLGNAGTMNPVQQMVQEWGKSQGSTTASFTPAGNQNVVFGDDIVGEDGRIIKGWRHGDRVSFVDGDTRISEVIVGWTLTANAGETLEVSPILGREDNGVLAQLGERIRGAERTSKKTALAPPRRVPAKEVEDLAEDVFDREGSVWSEKIRENVEAATRASEESRVHSKRSSVFSGQSVVHSEQARVHSDQSAVHSDASWGFSQNSLDYSRDSFAHAEEAGEWSDLSWEHSQASAEHSDASRIASEASSEASRQAGIHSEQAWDYSDASKRYSEASSEASRQAGLHSDASLAHSETAKGHSEDAAGHSADANTASLAAGGHSTASQTAASEAAGHSSDASLASQAAAGHSTTAKGHSDTASQASRDASTASRSASEYSGSAWDYSKEADKAALAAGESEDAAAEWRRLAEVARSLAEQERKTAEEARDDAEEARRLAEEARSLAEGDRADAEAARDRAEQARARSMASMAAAEMMRAQAEEARRLAENARALAEDERRDAEIERGLAEAARDEAEGFRDDAETKRSQAEGERREAEGFRDEAEGFRDEAETKRSLAEGERKDAELARGQAEQARARSMAAMSAAEMMRMQAEQSRAMAEQERKKAELERAAAEDERKDAEIARDAAETARSDAEGYRTDAFNHMESAFSHMQDAETARDDSIAEIAEYSWLANFRRVRILSYERGNSSGSIGMSHLWENYDQMLHAYLEPNHIVLNKVGVWSGTLKISVMTSTSKYLVDTSLWHLGTSGQEGFQMDFGSELWDRVVIEVHPSFLNAEDRTFFRNKATAFRPLM